MSKLWMGKKLQCISIDQNDVMNISKILNKSKHSQHLFYQV